ncbi:putative Pentatricopeptide repeat domain containing protein [Klebsormidium nitens]|uniref:Putative Pentatricopeptide repeat domain containing protein n=1 Tax=Klebsormidium nitens TaxID=105231 RepID=A0A1Y1HK68_KLENI|nr:putative Pentatricopeptide repeat domain containing protein [Klebsormidium nitens]|eukprot:GAQ78965.1 putative Pentatricopeptide repeat domain containing protein [Klebsormidium nitens]
MATSYCKLHVCGLLPAGKVLARGTRAATFGVPLKIESASSQNLRRKHPVLVQASVATEAPPPAGGPDGVAAAQPRPRNKGRQPRNKASWRKEKEATGDVVQAASALLQPKTEGESAQSGPKILDWLNEEGVDKTAEATIRRVNRAISTRATVREALQVVEDMKEAGLSANEGTFAALVTVCRRQKQGERALVVYDAMKQAGIKASKLTFRNLILACQQAGMQDQALTIKKDMMASGYKPDLGTYSALLQAIVKMSPYRGRITPGQRLDKALDTYQEMKAADIKPDVIVFNTLLSAAERAKNPGKALEIYALMAQAGIKANRTTFETLLQTVGHSGRLKAAEEVFNEMRVVGVAPRTATFNFLIEACGTAPQPQVQKAFGYVEEMKKSEEAKPNVETYIRLINTASRGPSPGQALRAYKLLVEAGFREKVGLSVYNRLISAAGQAGKLDKAFEIYDTLREAGFKPDGFTYSALVAACGKAGDASRALAVSEDMEKGYGLLPNQVVFHALMGACGKAGKWQEALALFRRMKEALTDEPPGVLTYSILFDACFGAQGAEALLKEAQKEGKRLEITQGIKAALNLYREGQTAGVFKNFSEDDLTRCDIRTLSRSGAVVALLALLDRLKEKPPTLDLVVVTGSDKAKAFIARGATKKPTGGRLPKLAEIALSTFNALQLPCKPLTTLTFQALTVEAPALQKWLQGGIEGGESLARQQSSVESAVGKAPEVLVGNKGTMEALAT